MTGVSTLSNSNSFLVPSVISLAVTVRFHISLLFSVNHFYLDPCVPLINSSVYSTIERRERGERAISACLEVFLERRLNWKIPFLNGNKPIVTMFKCIHVVLCLS